MSMLTPPGMGGKYKITGNAYPRMRRSRRRHKLLTAVAVLACVGVLGWGTLQLLDVFTGRNKADAAQKPRCDPPSASASPKSAAASRSGQSTGAAKSAKTITVNVYNATTRPGLAKATADELKKRGFKIGKVGNASPRYDKKVKETAVLVAGPRAEKDLTVLSTHLTGARSEHDKRTDATVDLVIGKAYKKLETPQAARKALATVAKPTPTARAQAGDC